MNLSRIPLALLALSLAGCAGGGGPLSPQAAGVNPRIPEPASSGLLRTGDSLTITLQGVGETAPHSVTIDEQGFVSLPFVGPVKAGGSGVSELQKLIIDSYITRKIYTNLAVSVSVAERYVVVGGEVARPGRIIWTSDLSLTKAIQAAGGFSLYAKATAVRVSRDNTAYIVDVKLAQKNPDQDPRLYPGDSVLVDRTAF